MVATKNSPLSPNEYSRLMDGIFDIGSKMAFSNVSGNQAGPDEGLVDELQGLYSKALDSLGMNFKNPLAAYSSHFRKDGGFLGLDPQRVGPSYVFFSRPNLNLTERNITLMPYVDYITNSDIGKLACRLLSYPDNGKVEQFDSLNSEFLTGSPFNPLMTNVCEEVTGIKDYVLEKYETEADFRGFQNQYPKGIDGIHSIGEVNASFYDPMGSPIFISTLIHILYIVGVSYGSINPSLESIVERIIDFSFSIYIFNLSSDHETILRFSKLTGCFPLNLPFNTLNYTSERNSEDYKKIAITYGYNGFDPMNPAVLSDLNKLVWDNVVGPDNKTFDISSIPTSVPSKLIDTIGKERENNPSRWSSTPFIVGNKLLML